MAWRGVAWQGAICVPLFTSFFCSFSLSHAIPRANDIPEGWIGASVSFAVSISGSAYGFSLMVFSDGARE